MSNAETKSNEENPIKKEVCSQQTCKSKSCKKAGNLACNRQIRKIAKQS